MTREARPSLRHWILLGAVVLLTCAVVLPPLVNLGRYQHKIAESISRSIGRPVHVSSVTLRLLPLPSFEFSDFSVEERPEFGAEPILHSNSVVAYLRLLSLWRGKLEISRIHFDEASLNLVRAHDGTWNFSSILVQAARTSTAPTAQRYAGSAPRFPYIEATSSRINFKQGDEKTPLSFLNADLSVWLANPDEWTLRFRAQPVRTDLDLDLADTGVLQVNGTLHRATMLSQMPLKLKAQWSNAPLGQLSRLATGRDIGWRGDLDVQSEVAGTADLARISTQIKINGLHRAEFAPAHPLDLQTSCHASYRKATSSLEDILCASPVGSGQIRLTGQISDVQTNPQAGVIVDIEGVPASAVLSGLQEVRNGLGVDIQAAGILNGEFQYLSNAVEPSRASTSPSTAGPSITGEMGLDSLTLSTPDSGKPLAFGPMRLLFETRSAPASNAALPGLPAALLLQPVRLPMGAAPPLSIDGRFTLDGFDFHLNGAATLARLDVFTRDLGLLNSATGRLATATASTSHEPSTPASVSLDVNVRGPWVLPIPDPDHPVTPSTTVGSVTLKNAELRTPYLSRPLKIVSAQAILGPNEITWTNAAINFGTLEAQGRLEYPTVCTTPIPCSERFQLIAPTLDLGALQSALDTNENGELLHVILDRIDPHSSSWPKLTGNVQLGELSAGKLVLHEVTGAIDISGNSMEIRSLNGRLMNGELHLSGKLNAASGQPEYQLDLQVANAAPSAIAGIFDERWGSGLLNFSAQLKMAGFETRQLANSTTGTLHWNWSKGTLAGQTPATLSQLPLNFDEWSGDAAVEDSTITIKQSLLARGAEAIPITGTISFDREVELKSESPSHAFAVTGTLEHPQVKSISTEAQAQPAP